jgi:hypothetical protein
MQPKPFLEASLYTTKLPDFVGNANTGAVTNRLFRSWKHFSHSSVQTKRAFFLVKAASDGDQGTTSKDLIQVPIGPATRARAKKFKDVLNGLIQELWAQANSWRPIEHDPQRQQRIVTLIQVLEG